MNTTDVISINTVMPIIAEGCVPLALLYQLHESQLSESQKIDYTNKIRDIFAHVKACGFNSFICEDSINTAHFILDVTSETSENNGHDCCLPAFLRHESALDTPYKTIQAIKDFGFNPRTLGWNLIDEPLYFNWGDAVYGTTQNSSGTAQYKWNNLTLGYMICKELCPSKIIYTTLAVPEISGGQRNVIGNCKDYESFLDELHRLYKPQVWVYDVYPVTKKHVDDQEVFVIRHSHFYYALRMFSDQSLKTGSPFWAYGMIHGHNLYSEGDSTWTTCFPPPTIGELKFEIFSALACGAQGIVFYKFGSSRYLVNQREDEQGGLFTTATACMLEDNEPGLSLKFDKSIINPTTQIITEIKKYNHVFFGANVICKRDTSGNYIPDTNEIYQIGTNYKIGKTDKYSFKTGNGIAGLINVSVRNDHPNPDSKGVLLSQLVNGNKKYVVLVSHDPLAEQIIGLTFPFNTNQGQLSITQLKLVTSAAMITNYPYDETDIIKVGAGTSGKNLKDGLYRLEAGGYLIFEIIIS